MFLAAGPFVPLLAVVFAALNEVSRTDASPHFEMQESGVTANLRGISAVSDAVVWASGENGTIVRTLDGGEHWEKVISPSIFNPDNENVDFRDIQAFSETTAIVMAVARPARFFKTSDGGVTWKETYRNYTEGIFYDAMDFWPDGEHGIAFGDPIDGRMTLIKTDDGGDTWHDVPFEERPEVPVGVHAFAASGTCLRTHGDGRVDIVLGGHSSMIYSSSDWGMTWHSATVDVQGDSEESGLFSVDFLDDHNGIVVGGNYDGDALTLAEGDNAAITEDGGDTWRVMEEEHAPVGYRSAVAVSPQGWVGPVGHDNQRLVLAVGKESCDFAFHDEASSADSDHGQEEHGHDSDHGHEHDQSISGLDFHPIENCPGFTSVSFPKAVRSSTAFASGYDGKMAKLTFH